MMACLVCSSWGIWYTNRLDPKNVGEYHVSVMRSGMFYTSPWWGHQMETFSALPAICAGNSPVPGEFPAQRPVARSFDVFFDLRLNKRLGKQSWSWWFETLSRLLWRHRNSAVYFILLHWLTTIKFRLKEPMSIIWSRNEHHISVFLKRNLPNYFVFSMLHVCSACIKYIPIL